MDEPTAPQADISRPAPPPGFLVLPQLFAIVGEYPAQGGPGSAENVLAMIQTFAGADAWGAPRAEGQSYRVDQYQALYSLIGPFYGGDGELHFDIPDLHGRSPIGGNPGEMGAQSLAMSALVCTSQGDGPPPGTIAWFAGNFPPPGWHMADGTIVTAEQYPFLMELFGTTYGGQGWFFALPNLTGRTAIGAGQGPGLAPVTLGQQVAGPVPALGVSWMICVEGALPPADGDGGFPATGPWVGQIVAYAGAQPPPGWLAADGALLPVEGNPGLFQIIGTTYGGDGKSDFALPDLRGRTVQG